MLEHPETPAQRVADVLIPVAVDQAYTYASRTAARYGGNAILTFIDGHASLFSGASVVDPSSGKAYFVAYPGNFPTGAARIYWEVDPTVSPNS